jgi:Domain of unknown function (DUF4158)
VPRRSVLTKAQRASLLALPEDEADLVRFWTLSADDLRIIVSRRRAHNRLGFAGPGAGVDDRAGGRRSSRKPQSWIHGRSTASVLVADGDRGIGLLQRRIGRTLGRAALQT